MHELGWLRLGTTEIDCEVSKKYLKLYMLSHQCRSKLHKKCKFVKWIRILSHLIFFKSLFSTFSQLVYFLAKHVSTKIMHLHFFACRSSL